MKKIFAVALSIMMIIACSSAFSVSAAGNDFDAVKTLAPNADGSVTVTITLTGHAQQIATDGMAKADVMLVLDLSSSMVNETIDEQGTNRMQVLKPAACSLVDALIGGENSQCEVGIVTFWSGSELTAGLTNDAAALKETINGLEAKEGTAMSEALATAQQALVETGRADAPDIIVLVTDGSPYEIGEDGVRIEDSATNFAIVSNAATACKSAGTIIYTVGIGLNDETSAFLQGCATDVTKAYNSVTGTDLGNVFADLGGAISVAASATNVTVSDMLGDGVYIPADAVVTSTSQYRPAETLVASTGSNGVILDKLGQIPYAPSVEDTETITITYVVKNNPGVTSAVIGTSDSFVSYNDAGGNNQAISLASSYEYQPAAAVVDQTSPQTGVAGIIPAFAVIGLSGAVALFTRKKK